MLIFFLKFLLDESDCAFAFPIVRIESFDSQCKSLANICDQIATSVLTTIATNEPQSLLGNFSQIRVLTEVHHRDTFIGHITVSFDQNRTQSVSLENIKKITRLGQESGLYYFLTSEKEEAKNSNSKKGKDKKGAGKGGKDKGKEKSHTVSLGKSYIKFHTFKQTNI